MVQHISKLRVDIITVVVDVGRYVDGTLNEVDRYVIEVWVGNQLKLGQVQLLGVRIRPLVKTHRQTDRHTGRSQPFLPRQSHQNALHTNL